MAPSTSKKTTNITTDQVLCNLASLAVLRKMWAGPYNENFDASNAAIQQLEILDGSIPTMDLDELIKSIDNLNDMGDFTHDLGSTTEEEIVLIEKVLGKIFEAFETNYFTATVDEYAQAIKTLAFMYRDAEGEIPGLETLRHRMMESLPIRDPYLEHIISAKADSWKPPILTKDGLAEVMAKDIERYGTILREGKVFTGKIFEMADALSRSAAKKLELAGNEIAAPKAELQAAKARLSDAEVQLDGGNASIPERGKSAASNLGKM